MRGHQRQRQPFGGSGAGAGGMDQNQLGAIHHANTDIDKRTDNLGSSSVTALEPSLAPSDLPAAAIRRALLALALAAGQPLKYRKAGSICQSEARQIAPHRLTVGADGQVRAWR